QPRRSRSGCHRDAGRRGRHAHGGAHGDGPARAGRHPRTGRRRRHLSRIARGLIHHWYRAARGRRPGDGHLVPDSPVNDHRKETSVDNEAAFDKFKTCAVEVLQVQPDQLTLDARFGDDLDADSLDLVELVMALEEAFDITIDESELEGIETVEQAFNLITSKL